MKPVAAAIVCAACIAGIVAIEALHIKDGLLVLLLTVGMILSFLEV